MQIPDNLATLLEQGVIEEVIRPLMSGKEAQVYLVVAEGEERVAKVYKEAHNRSFKHRSVYTEGRQVRNSRDRRALERRSRHGRAQDEAAWRSTEVDMIYRLRDAGVRVPVPYSFVDGVLIMELIQDAEGNPAPRLGDVRLSREQTRAVFDQLLREVVKMLCAGVVHGDLSDFNVLIGRDGPVIIDFPQSLNAAHNQNTRSILLRDVSNLVALLGRHESDGQPRHFAEEMWALYERGELAPDSPLTGRYHPPQRKADVKSVLREIDDVRREEERRRAQRGLPALPPARTEAAAAGARSANPPAARPASARPARPWFRSRRPKSR